MKAGSPSHSYARGVIYFECSVFGVNDSRSKIYLGCELGGNSGIIRKVGTILPVADFELLPANLPQLE